MYTSQEKPNDAMAADATQNLIQNTFADMGRRTKKVIAEHFLAENAYENNLLSDVLKIDYLAGNRVRTPPSSLVAARVC